ncbi:hypothetical protein ANO11243_056800 [Dothideomycetidae sp. 11243]|nr:hypothetical protein ANO11243_056800 [fungal sp. No.11243]
MRIVPVTTMSGGANHGHEPQPIHFVVVGAGIGGLAAGLALRQAGHKVTIVESSSMSNETGAAIHVAPNCNGLLRRAGLRIENVGANPMNKLSLWLPHGVPLMSHDLRPSNALWQHPWLLVHRAHLHTALREATTGKTGKGTPCELRLGSRVMSVNAAEAEVKLLNGDCVKGDVLLGADGVHSVCRGSLPTGDSIRPYDGGSSAFRWLVPTQDILDDPVTAPLVDSVSGTLTMNMAEDRRIVYYPCNNNTLMNFLLIHPSELTRVEGAGWNQKGDKTKLMEIASPFAPAWQALVAKAPADTLKVWTLLDMDVLPTWTTGRMALLGDAAHPFLPHQAQGGAQAIEDAFSLAALFPLGSTSNDVLDRLALYQDCRKERADKIQHMTRVSGMSMKEQMARGLRYDPQSFNLYNFDHDEWDHSSLELRKHLLGKQAYYSRQGLSFGPSPGPRQPLNKALDSLDHSKEHQDVRSIRFSTSATYLRTLFPTKSFSFSQPGTFAQASLICRSACDMTWLNGGGYNTCELYIHGVTYTKADGTKVHGGFVPVLFTDSADSVSADREELGMPSWTVEIKLDEPEDDKAIQTVRLAWRGYTFATLKWDTHDTTGTAEKESVPASPSDEGTLLHRCIPAVGQPGKMDVEYTVMKPRPTSKEEKVISSEPVGQASVVWDRHDWRALPTLHHVVDALSQVPIYEVLEAKIEHVQGVDNGARAYRIE